ncbi:S-adenosylmethionine synthetase [Mycoplasma haemocanis str. Illinois]|uniref:Methionine adenosyltransferase n=1 Tax=Mycoplasma haemocanis (strain Illinois) TaxID=1111676 RepID=H6N8L6_MYCHN|nr:methionine adenosyltransferase [Mycoplasma haemocanis]AEW45988.1 S-adenosylmethionine synthetase [Mycoplasma haemocanis str. Illinois]
MLLRTSEAVGTGHPDKIADRIAEEILEAVSSQDIHGRVACEVLVSRNIVAIAGEITTEAKVNYEEVARKSLSEQGYDPSGFRFVIDIKNQSEDIERAAIERGIKSGDQSVVYGFAADETDNFLPIDYAIARDLIVKTEDLIDSGKLKWAKKDMKVLVSIRVENQEYYLEDLLFSIQHTDNVDLSQIKKDIFKEVLVPVVEGHYSFVMEKANILKNINKSGRFVIGGLDADTGVSNRKLVIDSYGTNIRHGGGGLCGKDLSKIDRVGAYYARWICKNFVAAGVCRFMELQLAYSFGSERPMIVSVAVDSDESEEDIKSAVEVVFPFTVSELVDRFRFSKFSYKDLIKNGHFGDESLPWEKTDKVEDIKDYFLD